MNGYEKKLHENFFLRKTISNKMFHSDYKHIIDRLPESLVKRAYEVGKSISASEGIEGNEKGKVIEQSRKE